jgi:hypothetical protein
MKKIYTTKPNKSVVPGHRSFRRFVSQMLAGILKRQVPNHQDEVIQRLKNLENKIETMARAMSRQVRRDR